jgi:hypothetical protein
LAGAISDVAASKLATRAVFNNFMIFSLVIVC